ncbi:MAG TPA: hypothetical protein VKY26_11505 [Actinomycetota bacterium]|nr:hypothetical protein [Actinomycetota bacterium]
MATVHQNGDGVHPCVDCAEHPGLQPLAELLAARGYADGVRREVLAHALAFDGLDGDWAAELLMPADLPDARACLATTRDTDGVKAMASARGMDAPADASLVGPDPEDLAWDFQYHVRLEEASPAPRTLAEQVDHEAIAYRVQGTELGDFLAGQMDRLAQLIRLAEAETVAQFLDRFEAMESWAREAHYERGYQDGRSGTFSIV